MTNNLSPRGILWLSLPAQSPPVCGVFADWANHFHVTLQFGTPNFPESLLGQTFHVRAISNCFDESIHALLVELPEEISKFCNNDHPHMTISMAKGVRPVQSNVMLAGEHLCEFHPFQL